MPAAGASGAGRLLGLEDVDSLLYSLLVMLSLTGHLGPIIITVECVGTDIWYIHVHTSVYYGLLPIYL